MDDLLTQERAAHDYVKALQSHGEIPFQVTLNAFDAYRMIVQNIAITSIADSEKHESQLWTQHVETRQMLSKTLRDLRRKQEQKTVEIRVGIEMYLRFLKHSIRFYRKFIHQLSTHFGVPELQSIAHQVKPYKSAEEAEEHQVEPELRDVVSRSCHRTLIYLGDLCRYRATDKLDKEMDFGPALGYYGLACTLRPESGWGHHQQAIVALETKEHLQASYHLYRSLLVAEPVPGAKKSLLLHFERSNAAWEKSELIRKGPPGGPDNGMLAIIGLFVRLHAVCITGEPYRGYEELERELLTRFLVELRSRSLERTLIRMLLVNFGAQHCAMENYRELQTAEHEQAFYYFMRINIVFFTTLLDVFNSDLINIAKDRSLVEAELESKLKVTMSRILPAIRLYSAWLLLNSHLLLGLASNSFLSLCMATFWQTYTRTLDLVSAVFPIWDLEDSEPVGYMLEEDVATLGYLPIDDVHAPKLVRKLFCSENGTTQKPKFSDGNVKRLSNSEEALARILGFLECGSFVANDIEDSPIFIRATRFVLGSNAEPFELPTPPPPKPIEKPAPLSYAAAAKTSTRRPPTSDASKQAIKNNSEESRPTHADVQLSRMVDSLVDDEDPDHPVTPPPQYLSNPTVVPGAGELFDVPSLAPSPKFGFDLFQPDPPPTPKGTVKQRKPAPKGHPKRTEDLSDFSPRPRIPASNAQLWSPASPNQAPTSVVQRSSHSPMLSPVVRSPHQRVNSNNSMRSGASDGRDVRANAPYGGHVKQGSRGHFESPVQLLASTSAATSPERAQISPGRTAKPLLFGSGSIWSAMPASRPDSED